MRRHSVRPSYYVIMTCSFLACAWPQSRLKRLIVAGCGLGVLELVFQEISEDAALAALDHLESRIITHRSLARRQARPGAQCAAPGDGCQPEAPR